MRRAAPVLVTLALALGGCSIGQEDRDEPARGDTKKPPASQGSTEASAIRAWSTALNEGDFDAAASYFAPGAVVEQTQEIRLADRRAAVAFNRSLPCKADLTDLERERGTVLAAFRLRDGSGGPCEGGARVRFRFRDGKFTEWRQLEQPEQPDGPVV